MNVLVLGSGGREHALVRALKISKSVSNVHVYPGNDGMTDDGKVWSLESFDLDSIWHRALRESIDLVVVGPDQFLAEGTADFFRDKGMPVFGPGREGSKLEWSKIFAKEFMTSVNIPTSRFQIVQCVEEVTRSRFEFSPPWVLKVDGLALGKGVYICESPQDLDEAAKDIFEKKKFGKSGERALLEEFVPGWELSAHVLVSEGGYRIFPFAQDHKRLKEGNQGPNTGGMGCIAPIAVSPEISRKIEEQVVAPAVAEIHRRGLCFRGILFAGVMVSGSDISVLEFNTRFGDPEAQVYLPLLDGDWGKIFKDVSQGRNPEVHWRREHAAVVVLASAGYPDQPQRGVTISSIPSPEENAYVLSAGVRRQGTLMQTSGGRVLNAVGTGESLELATQRAYEVVSKIEFEGMQWRKDIGAQFLRA